MVPRAHFGPMPIARVEISIDEPRYRWMREHGTLHVPDSARRTIFRRWVPSGTLRTRFWPFPFVSKGNSLER